MRILLDAGADVDHANSVKINLFVRFKGW